MTSAPHSVPEITPQELVRRVDAGEPIQVLDVRPPDMVAAARVDVVPPERFANLVGSKVFAAGGVEPVGLDRARPIAVVCARGMASRSVAEFLNARGYDAASLRGGMAGWLHALVPRELAPPRGLDRLVQVDRPAKGALGYLLVAGGEALVVDPPRRWEGYAELAEAAEARVVGVADTHVHADYLSGAAEMAASLGVPYHLHGADASDPYDGTPARLSFSDLADCHELAVGGAAVRVLPTPGHTLGSVTFAVGDEVALTGDFVFVRSIGRPDLGDRSAEWTEVLWRTLDEAKRTWSDGLRVLPAHYAGADERGAGGAVQATFGELRRTNEALAIADAESFRRWVAARSGRFPDAYRTIKRANVGLVALDDELADELEAGRNQCALAG
jgi:glyoxylase-like metal-dependent hydrolase (beta-lactamase superfamily II)